MKRIPELDEELLELIREETKQVVGINRIRAITLLRQRYGLSITDAKNYTEPLYEIVYKEKFGEEPPNKSLD